ncbi:MAG: hypothetical protein AB7O62_23595 [Pirellulales bacterium]
MFDTPYPGQRPVDKIERQQQGMMVVEEFSVGSPVAIGTNGMHLASQMTQWPNQTHEPQPPTDFVHMPLICDGTYGIPAALRKYQSNGATSVRNTIASAAREARLASGQIFAERKKRGPLTCHFHHGIYRVARGNLTTLRNYVRGPTGQSAKNQHNV